MFSFGLLCLCFYSSKFLTGAHKLWAFGGYNSKSLLSLTFVSQKLRPPSASLSLLLFNLSKEPKKKIEEKKKKRTEEIFRVFFSSEFGISGGNCFLGVFEEMREMGLRKEMGQ